MKFAILCIAFLLASGCISTPASEEPAAKAASIGSGGSPAYSYYSSPMFLLYHPRGWSVDDSRPGVFIFTAPPAGSGGVASQFIVEIWAGNESAPEEYANYEKSLMAQGDAIIKSGASKYQGRDAFVIEMSGPADGGRGGMLYKTTFFRNGKWVYRLHYAIDEKNKAADGPVMEEILGKFKIGSYGT